MLSQLSCITPAGVTLLSAAARHGSASYLAALGRSRSHESYYIFATKIGLVFHHDLIGPMLSSGTTD